MSSSLFLACAGRKMTSIPVFSRALHKVTGGVNYWSFGFGCLPLRLLSGAGSARATPINNTRPCRICHRMEKVLALLNFRVCGKFVTAVRLVTASPLGCHFSCAVVIDWHCMIGGASRPCRVELRGSLAGGNNHEARGATP